MSRRRRTRRVRRDWLVRFVKAIRRTFAPGRHATGDRSLARQQGPAFRRGRAVWCDSCDRPVDALHPACGYCPTCCPCTPPDDQADPTGRETHQEGTP